jgi:hypothetical protein
MQAGKMGGISSHFADAINARQSPVHGSVAKLEQAAAEVDDVRESSKVVAMKP